MTMTLSLSMIVFSRWATVSTVHAANLVRMVRWISASVCGSTFAVASSNIRTLLFRRTARARQTSWRCPTLKFEPRSRTRQSRPLPDVTIASRSSTYKYTYQNIIITVSIGFNQFAEFLPTSSRASHSALSGNSLKGSKLRRRVPENSTGSCGMMDMRLLKSSRAMEPVSIPSISIAPSKCASLNNAAISDDFPAPVRPTIPTC